MHVGTAGATTFVSTPYPQLHLKKELPVALIQAADMMPAMSSKLILCQISWNHSTSCYFFYIYIYTVYYYLLLHILFFLHMDKK